jgi:hypothetical protein
MWLSTLATMNATNPASIDLTNGEFAHAKSHSQRLRNHYEQNAATRTAPVAGSSWTISSVCRCSRNF